MDTTRIPPLPSPTILPDMVAEPISVGMLRDCVGSANSPLILDVRRQAAFDADPRMIVGSVWRDPFSVQDWLKFIPRHRQVVAYCVHGHEISRNVASALRAAGIDARYLADGIEAWNQQDGPCITKRDEVGIPPTTNAPTIWVTRERPKIDRIACPWLVRRFIDPFAEFRYVPSQDVGRYAEVNAAIPFDVPGVRFTHRGERGERCSFDTLIQDFEINDEALGTVAAIVRGADTDQLAIAPQAAGLLAISLGLSKLHLDDQVMLQYGMPVYDALYAWAKHARAEEHNAKMFASKSIERA